MESVIAAIITGALALIGVLVTNSRSAQAMDAKLDRRQAVMDEKLEELTREVRAHNQLVERTYRLEERAEVQEEKIKVANHRIDDLERGTGT